MQRISRLLQRSFTVPKGSLLAASVSATLVATAAWVAYKARRTEGDEAQSATFVEVDGVRVHYVDRGTGTPVVLLHGNAVRLEDFAASGLIEKLAETHRVIAFDRPGFGLSERPRDRLWTPQAQAELLHKAFAQLGIERPVVLGHSWGTLVAIALALRENVDVQRLILVSGYYFPAARLDVLLAAPAAIPIIGDVMRYTVSAILTRLLLRRSIKAMFAPQAVPGEFLPVLRREMLVRPGQIRANAEDAAFMIPGARALSKRYAELTMPVAIFAGEADKIVDPERHARKLHAVLSNSELKVVRGQGHMLHYGIVEEIIRSARP
jgi:pimeloyl-ACP methyl ester carboxylesterase